MTQRVQDIRRCWKAGCWLACAAAVLLGASARAADTETRDFAVRVDGKPAGSASITIQRQDDGTTVVTCNTKVRVKVLIKTYVYTCQTRETWKNGRLQQLAGSCYDDGKRFQVSASAQADGVHVRVNGREHISKPEVWVTSYWTLPDAKLRDQAIPALEADNGRDMQGRLQLIGAAQVPVAGQMQNVQHYRFNGPTRVDLYYDAAQRLVRRTWAEEGHPTELELVGIRR
ncbi:MAG TPA: DUF6134 family protein [Gemmataceae bacterium]|nr:DUF6134 family protein [Gemmataceae bacterium]